MTGYCQGFDNKGKHYDTEVTYLLIMNHSFKGYLQTI